MKGMYRMEESGERSGEREWTGREEAGWRMWRPPDRRRWMVRAIREGRARGTIMMIRFFVCDQTDRRIRERKIWRETSPSTISYLSSTIIPIIRHSFSGRRPRSLFLPAKLFTCFPAIYFCRLYLNQILSFFFFQKHRFSFQHSFLSLI